MTDAHRSQTEDSHPVASTPADVEASDPTIRPTDSSPHNSVVYRRFVLVMLTVVYGFNFIDRQILVILQEPIKLEMGLSDAQLGLLSGFTFAIIYVTAGIPIAYLADRSNRRNIIAIALTVWSGMTALSGFAQNYWQLLLARVGVGLGEAGGSPPAHSIISDYFPPERRATALSFYSTGIYVGILLGYAFGGLLAATFGWRMAFLVVGLPGIVLAVLLLVFVREPSRGRWDGNASLNERPTLGETLTLLRRRKSFPFVALGCAMTAFVAYGNGNFYPSFLIRNHGMDIAQVGLVLSLVAGISGGIGTFAGGYLADRLIVRDRRWYTWVPILGLVLALPGFYILISDNTTVVLVLMFLVGIVNSLYLGPSIAVSHAMMPPQMRALTSAVLFFVLNMIGLGLGPFITGLNSDLLADVSGADNLRHAMLITAGLGLSGLFFFWRASQLLLDDLDDASAHQPANEHRQ
ncbi:MAG: MFS transporter [Pseudomonadota bacterium]